VLLAEIIDRADLEGGNRGLPMLALDPGPAVNVQPNVLAPRRQALDHRRCVFERQDSAQAIWRSGGVPRRTGCGHVSGRSGCDERSCLPRIGGKRGLCAGIAPTDTRASATAATTSLPPLRPSSGAGPDGSARQGRTPQALATAGRPTQPGWPAGAQRRRGRLGRPRRPVRTRQHQGGL
jgi:hypothetical protein